MIHFFEKFYKVQSTLRSEDMSAFIESLALLQISELVLNEKFQQKASRLATFYYYIQFVLQRSTLFSSLSNALVYVDKDLGYLIIIC